MPFAIVALSSQFRSISWWLWPLRVLQLKPSRHHKKKHHDFNPTASWCPPEKMNPMSQIQLPVVVAVVFVLLQTARCYPTAWLLFPTNSVSTFSKNPSGDQSRPSNALSWNTRHMVFSTGWCFGLGPTIKGQCIIQTTDGCHPICFVAKNKAFVQNM